MTYSVACVLVACLLVGSVHAQIQVTKTANGKDATLTITAGAGRSGGGGGSSSEPNGASNLIAAAPSQQPAMSSPPPKTARMAASNAAWQVSAGSSAFNPLGSFRLLSPLCPEGTEATSCASFSGNTAVVVSSVMPAVGTNTNVKTTQCFCDYRNTINALLPLNPAEVYRCAAYCQ